MNINYCQYTSSMRTFLKNSMVAAILTFATSSAMALPSDRNQPISLVADRATFNEKTGVTTYTGNVIIEQGTMKLQAASIVANLNSRKEIATITATGSPARFQQQIDAQKGLAKGQAQKIVYNAETGIINMTGNALLEQDGASISGGSLRYSMNKGDIEAVSGSNTTSGGRVKIVIPPSANKSFPGARD